MSSTDKQKVAKLVKLLLTDESFRRKVRSNPTEAIDEYQGKLGFGSKDVSKDVIDTFSSLTDEEIRVMNDVRKRLGSLGLEIETEEEITPGDLTGGVLF